MSCFRPSNVVSRLRLVLFAAVLCAPALAAAQTATVTGRVLAEGAGQRVSGARVFLVGTNSATATAQDGHYTLRSTPGQFVVRVIRVGFLEQKKSVTVPASGSITVDFSMAASVIKLTEVVTTATGEQRKVELGNSVQTLGDISQKVETAPVTNLSDLLVAKAPGVVVLPGNMSGSAPTVRIRGIKSISLSTDPIYIIDGVRMNAGTLGVGFTGTQLSLLNALNPEEIADIEIVKGPSAATLYGTDAANGVIVITTKKGTTGPARWTWHGGAGSVQDRNTYPTQYGNFGRATGVAPGGTPSRCTLLNSSPSHKLVGGVDTTIPAACVIDSTTSYNLLADPAVSPIIRGNNRQGGGQVSGGTDLVRYFLSADYEGEDGPVSMPLRDQNYLQSIGEQVREDWMHPEYFRRNSFRANVNTALSPKLDVSFNAGYTNTDQRIPQVDNNLYSFYYQAFNNPGFKPNFALCSATPATCLGYSDKGSLGEELGGFTSFTPANIFQDQNDQRVDRIIASSTADWRPFSWMSNQGTIGMDQAQRDFYAFCQLGDCENSGTRRLGFATETRAADRNLSGKLLTTSTWQPKSSLNLRTTFGADYTNSETENLYTYVQNLPPGANSIGAGALMLAYSNQLPRAAKTLGYYAQEQAAFNDRLFLTAAVRTDQNSAFGTQFQRVVYPKASASYIISDESFFPKVNFLNNLRLRASYGASGVQPGSTTALQTFAASTVNINAANSASGTDSPGLLAAALGNPALKPERSTEREMGFESRMFGSRLNFDYTYYNNVTNDALINVPIAGSAGPSSLTVTRNYGSIRNTGHEATLTATLIDRRSFSWDVTIGGSHNTNNVESLGLDATGKPNPTIANGDTRDSVGFPINAIFLKPYTYSDKNGDGIISADEVTVAPICPAGTTGAQAKTLGCGIAYVGYSVPRDIITVQNGFDLFQRKLHLSFLLDYKGGFSLLNGTTQFFCQQTNTCADETVKGTSLANQARAVVNRFPNPLVAAPNNTTCTDCGYYESGQFWRLREIGATITVPDQIATRMRARDASLTFTGRNLHVWTKYQGTDPESNYSLTATQNDFVTTAPPTYITVRLNLHY